MLENKNPRKIDDNISNMLIYRIRTMHENSTFISSNKS